MEFKSCIWFVFLIYSIAFADPTSTPKEDSGPIVPVDKETFEKVCNRRSENLIKSLSFPGDPNYFVKPLVRNGKLYFTAISLSKKTWKTTSGIFDSETGKVTKIPIDQDPLPSFDFELVTGLVGGNGKFKIIFYDPSDINNLKPIASDIKIQGAYQSIAPLQKSMSGEKRYRIIVDEIVTKKVNGKDEGDYTRPTIIEVKRTKKGIEKLSKFQPCGDKKLQMPFVSKDGNFLAALNVDTQTTQVFDISNGGCDLKDDLGIFTGKADFSFDGNLIAFHLSDHIGEAGTGWIKKMESENVSNVFVYNRVTKKIVAVTKNFNSTSYYPSFLPDGTIMHIDSQQTGKNSSEVKYSIGISKVPDSQNSTEAKAYCDDCTEKRLLGRFALGQFLAGMCQSNDVLRDINTPADTYIILANQISHDECIKLIEKYWTRKLQIDAYVTLRVKSSKKYSPIQSTNLEKADLLAACKN